MNMDTYIHYIQKHTPHGLNLWMLKNYKTFIKIYENIFGYGRVS